MSELQGKYTKNWEVSSLGKLGLSSSALRDLERMTTERIRMRYERETRFIRAVVLFELMGHFEYAKAAALYPAFDIGYNSTEEKITAEQLLIIQRTQQLFTGEVPARQPTQFSRS